MENHSIFSKCSQSPRSIGLMPWHPSWRTKQTSRRTKFVWRFSHSFSPLTASYRSKVKNRIPKLIPNHFIDLRCASASIIQFFFAFSVRAAPTCSIEWPVDRFSTMYSVNKVFIIVSFFIFLAFSKIGRRLFFIAFCGWLKRVGLVAC